MKREKGIMKAIWQILHVLVYLFFKYTNMRLGQERKETLRRLSSVNSIVDPSLPKIRALFVCVCL